MKILITGGAGFIGSNFIYYYLKRHPERQLVCLDSMTYAANPDTLKEAKTCFNFQLIQGDITHRDQVFQLFSSESFDQVINFAAESHVDRSIEDPGLFLNTNIIGTQILMDAAREYGVARFHQVSTDEVYGDLPLDRPELLFSENNRLQASSPYAASKAAADLLALSYYRTYGFPVTISRCSNNYGPYQHLEKLIPAMIARCLSGDKLLIYGDGANVRDWLNVKDHCSALDLILEKGRPGQVYNIGGNNEKTNLEIVNIIMEELDIEKERIDFVQDRPGHDLRYAIDSSKMKKDLGWEPMVDFGIGIRDTINWYLSHQKWWL